MQPIRINLINNYFTKAKLDFYNAENTCDCIAVKLEINNDPLIAFIAA